MICNENIIFLKDIVDGKNISAGVRLFALKVLCNHTEEKEMKYVLEIQEMSADYENDIHIGWTTKSHRLEYFDSEEDANEYSMELAEAQDCDYSVDVKKLGWVDIPSN